MTDTENNLDGKNISYIMDILLKDYRSEATQKSANFLIITSCIGILFSSGYITIGDGDISGISYKLNAGSNLHLILGIVIAYSLALFSFSFFLDRQKYKYTTINAMEKIAEINNLLITGSTIRFQKINLIHDEIITILEKRKKFIDNRSDSSEQLPEDNYDILSVEYDRLIKNKLSNDSIEHLFKMHTKYKNTDSLMILFYAALPIIIGVYSLLSLYN
ncbi:hypothetical protein ACQZ19_23035 [Rahnella variigena]|uniref:hypothetical protein n=1 Tax=Rahnella variigena TaxID=574964 RepID=UPI003D266786